MDHLELYYEPRTIVCEQTEAAEWVEMTEFESAFLCGLLRQKRPHKILEVGVAGGGTTAIILQCLDMISRKEICEMYSVDLAKDYYRDMTKQTGFAAESVKKRIKPDIQHTFLLGDVLPEYLETIGKNIDFVILDTMHILPGELLDFLAVFPYLNTDACVVLHDIAASHLWGDRQTFATQLLLDTVTAQKIIIKDTDREYGYPNIGAFCISPDTKKYVQDCFHALSLTWSYMPEDDHLLKYRSCYGQYYDAGCLETFDMIVGMQKHVTNWSPEKCGYRYRLGTPVLFTNEENGIRYFANGISGIEKDFAWSCGKKSKACFLITDMQDDRHALRVTIKFQYIFSGRQHVKVTCKGEGVFERYLDEKQDREISFMLPEGCVTDQKLELEFEYPDACSPAQVGAGDDQRVLAVGFSEIRIDLASREK